MTDSTAHFSKLSNFAYRSLPEDDLDGDRALDRELSQLIAPTWAELESARDRYNRNADRLRSWQWWFVGMFTFYTTLVGILLFKLTVGS